MKTALKNHINTHLNFLHEKKLLVAISAGIDSVVLTHMLIALKFDITLAHCNFNLRGKQSNKDEKFVKKMGDKLGLPTFTTSFDTFAYAEKKGISTQMAARKLRYKWFKKLSEEHQLDYIITAHHKDDVIETFLINFTRGTGLEGLTGIPVVNKNIVRPLLIFSREEILVYATKNKLKWREDESNSSVKYIRNKIRHKVVPILKEINPNLLETFQNTLTHLIGSQQIVKDNVKQIQKKISQKIGDERHYQIEAIQNLSNPKAYLYELFHKKGFTAWNDVYNLLEAQSGKQVVSKTHRLLKNRDVLILSKQIKEPSTIYSVNKNTIKITSPLHLKFKLIPLANEGKNKANPMDFILHNETSVQLDADKLTFPLTIRKWQKGDFFYPMGLNGSKKLSKHFKDEKYSIFDKENTWLLCSNDAIVWVIGNRLDNRFKIDNKTQTIYSITIDKR